MKVNPTATQNPKADRVVLNAHVVNPQASARVAAQAPGGELHMMTDSGQVSVRFNSYAERRSLAAALVAVEPTDPAVAQVTVMPPELAPAEPAEPEGQGAGEGPGDPHPEG